MKKFHLPPLTGANTFCYTIHRREGKVVPSGENIKNITKENITMKAIIAEEIANEINKCEMLAATVECDKLISIDYLGKCGNDTVGECIEREYRSDYLRFIGSDDAANVAYYELDGGEICEPCEGGVMTFDSEWERSMWLKQA